MAEQWVVVFSSPNRQEIEVLKAMLEEEDIRTILINKQDSMYTSLNMAINIHLLVENRNVIKAKHLISSRL